MLRQEKGMTFITLLGVMAAGSLFIIALLNSLSKYSEELGLRSTAGDVYRFMDKVLIKVLEDPTLQDAIDDGNDFGSGATVSSDPSFAEMIQVDFGGVVPINWEPERLTSRGMKCNIVPRIGYAYDADTQFLFIEYHFEHTSGGTVCNDKNKMHRLVKILRGNVDNIVNTGDSLIETTGWIDNMASTSITPRFAIQPNRSGLANLLRRITDDSYVKTEGNSVVHGSVIIDSNYAGVEGGIYVADVTDTITSSDDAKTDAQTKSRVEINNVGIETFDRDVVVTDTVQGEILKIDSDGANSELVAGVDLDIGDNIVSSSSGFNSAYVPVEFIPVFDGDELASGGLFSFNCPVGKDSLYTLQATGVLAGDIDYPYDGAPTEVMFPIDNSVFYLNDNGTNVVVEIAVSSNGKKVAQTCEVIELSLYATSSAPCNRGAIPAPATAFKYCM